MLCFTIAFRSLYEMQNCFSHGLRARAACRTRLQACKYALLPKQTLHSLQSYDCFNLRCRWCCSCCELPSHGWCVCACTPVHNSIMHVSCSCLVAAPFLAQLPPTIVATTPKCDRNRLHSRLQKLFGVVHRRRRDQKPKDTITRKESET